MQNSFLLTYDVLKENKYNTYAWFECIELMKDFIKNNPDIKITEMIEILDSREVNFNND
jgi:hypothetical protein